MTSAVTSSLSDLIARLEKATGPDRETDLAIHLAVYPDSEIARLMAFGRGFDHRDGKAWELGAGSVLYENWSNGRCWSNGGYPLPAFTSSMDAAMTLVPEGRATRAEWLPHASYPARFYIAKDGAGCLYDDQYPFRGIARTEPLARAIAALKARSLPAI